MSGYLTTHVLDTAKGQPASGLRIELFHLTATARELLADVMTNTDGRTDRPVLPTDAFAPGTYELVFHAGAYFRANDQPDSFLDVIPLRFKMMANDHYHVPLLLSPFSFSTYRGS